ncbi:hypothetical protein Q3G72_034178 [Acer saccharum]|nr:hypothetical protein Q3G72_034178 [Acer saccharum]
MEACLGNIFYSFTSKLVLVEDLLVLLVRHLGAEEDWQQAMVLDTILSSPHRRSPSYRKQFPRDELGSSTTTCSGLTGTQKAMCQIQQAKDSVSKGKLKFL